MADHRDLLIEIGTEELPPKALQLLADAFRTDVEQGLARAKLNHGTVHTYATPRRLALLIEHLATVQPERQTERRGPSVSVAFDADGNPTKAAQGFARSCGAEVKNLERVATDAGEWLVFRATGVAQFSASLLPDIIRDSLSRLPIPKRMRWADQPHEFVRPLRWVLALFGNTVLECEIYGITAGNTTRGHRFHCPEPIEVREPRDYLEQLRSPGYVIGDFDERRTCIREDVERVAAQLGQRVVIDPVLLDEVTALTEWPVAIAGSFDQGFLEVPEQVLIATMQINQKYFHLVDEHGELLPRFIAVANLASSAPDSVRHGNERVIRPRLADAQFFYRTDLKTPLSDRLDALERVIFQRKLGSLSDKSTRISSIAGHVCIALGASLEDVKHARRAGLLSKCDLVTEMVGEFPELQGYIGGHYAAASGENEAVAEAVSAVYKPRFAGDELPVTTIGKAVAIADKLDTLTGIFGIKQPPSGDKDPFALRRAALGVLRIIIEGELDLDLRKVLDAAASGYQGVIDTNKLAATVFDFMTDRLRSYFSDRGIPANVFAAVQARAPSKPLDFALRVHAVAAFRSTPAGISLAAANKRIKNLLKQTDGKIPTNVNDTLFQTDVERNLAAKVAGITPRVKESLSKQQYDEALTSLASLRESVDNFFETVRVMDDDAAIRDNRVALLSSIDALFMQTADISLLQD